MEQTEKSKKLKQIHKLSAEQYYNTKEETKGDGLIQISQSSKRQNLLSSLKVGQCTGNARPPRAPLYMASHRNFAAIKCYISII